MTAAVRSYQLNWKGFIGGNAVLQVSAAVTGHFLKNSIIALRQYDHTVSNSQNIALNALGLAFSSVALHASFRAWSATLNGQSYFSAVRNFFPNSVKET